MDRGDGVAGVRREWKMHSETRSPAWTTDIS
ncbi:DUF4113 domain-containing protein [Sphingomonas sp. LR55]